MFSAIRNGTPEQLTENLNEMTELAVAAGLHPLETIKQNIKQIDPAYLVGVGKRKELEELVQKLNPSYIIFDHKLSGVQTRNLEKQLKVHVLDRNQLILEIFAQRAQSHEGKLQVHLAQLLDQMPRMVGAWLGSLSRQGGNAGSKGPGEKALEIDRRRAKERVKRIKEKLEKVRRNHLQHRAMRRKRQIPSFALIGYTNSGKSSLLNFLTKSKVETQNQPFMTLDPKTRKVFIPGVPQAVLTDTVGFIRDLPHHLIEAFKATLEESAEADILLHVIDSASPQIDTQIRVVNALIEEFKWNEKPIIHILNKSDLVPATKINSSLKLQPRVSISARTGYGISALLNKMKEAIENLSESVELYFPKEKEYEVYNLSRQTQINKKEIGKAGTVCHAQMTPYQISQWKKYIIK